MISTKVSVTMGSNMLGPSCQRFNWQTGWCGSIALGSTPNTPHSSLLVARQGDVSHDLNQAFLLVDWFSSNFFLLMDIQICMCLALLIIFYYLDTYRVFEINMTVSQEKTKKCLVTTTSNRLKIGSTGSEITPLSTSFTQDNRH